MRIIIEHILQNSLETTIDENITIRDLRIEIMRLFDITCWNEFTISNVSHANVGLGAIYLDDPADVKLIDLLKRKNTNLQNNIEELKIYITRFSPRGYTPTKYNSDGYSAYCGNISFPNNLFFQYARFPIPEFSFNARLNRIGFDIKTAKDVPAEFLDPVTRKIMDDPVITSEQRTIDSSTLEQMNYIDHVSGKKLTQHTIQNLRLRALIEDFVSAKETLYKQPYNIKEAEDQNNAKPVLLSNPLSANAAAGSANLPTPAIAVSANGAVVSVNPNGNPNAAATKPSNNAASVSASVSSPSANPVKDPKDLKDVKSAADIVTSPSKASSFVSSTASNPNASAVNASAAASASAAHKPPTAANSASTSTASRASSKIKWRG